MSDWNGRWTCHHELVKNILAHSCEVLFLIKTHSLCLVVLRQKFRKSAVHSSRVICQWHYLFLLVPSNSCLFTYLFSPPELYLDIHYRRIITKTSNKAANLSLVLSTVTNFQELTMHFRGTFLFYYSNCLQYFFHFFLWDN